MGLGSRKGARSRRALLIVLATLTGASLFASAEPASATPPPPPVPAGNKFVAVAGQSLVLGTNTKVLSGNVAVNEIIRNVIEVDLGAGTKFASGASVWADTVRFASGVQLPQVIANQVHTPPPATQIYTPFQGPASAFPAINSANPAYWNPLTVSENRTLAPGQYGDVRVASGVTLLLSGGAYHFRSLYVEERGIVRGAAPTEMRIAREVTVARSGRLEASDQVEARKMIVTSAAGSAAKFGPESRVRATVVMPEAAINFAAAAEGIGIFRARSITTGSGSTLRLDGPISSPPTSGTAKLSVDKTGPATAAPGANITYNLVVTNTGDAAAQGVTLTDVLPTSGTFVSSTPALTPASGKLTLNVGTLAAKASKQLSVVWKVPSSDASVVNKATATGTGLTAVADQVTTTVTATPPATEKKLTVDAQSPAQVQVGEDFDVEVLVKNGTDAVVKAASLAITLPTSGHFLGVDPKTTPSGGKLTIALGDLAAGATKRVVIHWRPTATGTLPTSATVTGTGATSATDSATTQVVSKPSESLDFQHLAGVRMTSDELADRLDEFPCVTGGGPVAAGKFSDALAEARTFAKSQTDTASYNAMKADLKDPRDASRMAGAALLLERPTAGLAVLLEAYDREPNNPDHLVNAAAFLVTLDKGFLALGFLAEAERVGGLTGSGLGISQQATLLTSRASALLALGDNAGAEKAARQATTLSPKSSEAQLALTNALNCLGRNPEAVAPYRKAINPEALPTATNVENGGLTGIDNFYAYDMPSGQPQMRLPAVPDYREINQTDAIYKRAYEELFPQENHRSDVRAARDRQLYDQAIASDWWAPATQRMIEETRLRIAVLSRDSAPLKAKWQAVDDAEKAIRDFDEYYRDCGDGGPWCNKWNGDVECRAALADYHKKWRPLEQAHTQAVDAYLQAAYPYWSAIVSNFTDPIAREMVQLTVDGEVDSLYYTFAVGEIASHASFIRIFFCRPSGGTIDAAPAEEELNGEETTTLCNKSTKKISFVVDFDVLKFSQSCEKSSLESKLFKWGWLSAFAKVEASRNGTSMYLGSKVSTPSSPPGALFGGSASFESGLYVKFDREGQFKDVGWRVGPKVTTSGGPLQVEVFDDRIDISFVGTVDYILGR